MRILCEGPTEILHFRHRGQVWGQTVKDFKAKVSNLEKITLDLCFLHTSDSGQRDVTGRSREQVKSGLTGGHLDKQVTEANRKERKQADSQDKRRQTDSM